MRTALELTKGAPLPHQQEQPCQQKKLGDANPLDQSDRRHEKPPDLNTISGLEVGRIKANATKVVRRHPKVLGCLSLALTFRACRRRWGHSAGTSARGRRRQSRC